MEERKPLAGIKVIEMAGYISGPYCGLLLAGLGAEVIKIEEPGIGDVARRCGPFLNDHPDLDCSGLFIYLNRAKKAITLNVRTATGRETLLKLLKGADVFIGDMMPLVAKRLKVTFKDLSRENPDLIVASITPFGQNGPYRDYKAYAINASAIGGMSLIIGEPDREPLIPPFSLGHFQTGIITANAVMFALMARKKTNKGQHLDISEAESWAIFHTANAVSAFIYAGRKRTRKGHRTPGPYPYTILPCKDGYLSMIALRGSEWKRFLEIVGDGEIPQWYSSDERFNDRLKVGMEYPEVLDNLLAPWLMSHTRAEIMARCREKHIAFLPVRKMDEVVNDEHLNYRKYFVDIDCHGQTFKVPGPPFRMSYGTWSSSRQAPALAEHNEEIYATLGYSVEDLTQMRRMQII